MPDLTPVLAGLAMLIGLVVLVGGWGLGVDGLVRLRPDFPAMVPETAIAMMVAGVGVILASRRRSAVLAGATLIALLGIDVVYVAAPLQLPGYERGDAMAVGTGAGFALLGVALLMRVTDAIWSRALTVVALVGGLMLSLSVLLTYLFDANELWGVLGFREMAIQTAAGIFLLHLAVAISYRDSAVLRGMLGRNRESRIQRAVWLASLLAIIGVSLGIYQLTQRGLMTAGFSFAILTSALIALTSVGAVFGGYLIGREQSRKRLLAALDTVSSGAAHRRALGEEQAEQLRMVEQIVSGVAHDFNNLIAVIRGNLELLQIDPGHRGQYIEQSLDASDKAAALSGQLLVAGRKARPAESTSDAAEVVDSVIDHFRREQPESIVVRSSIDLSCSRSLPKDGTAMSISLRHLLTNAVEAMPRGGTITVNLEYRRISNADVEARRPRDRLRPGRYVVLEVSDDGMGMDDTTRHRASEPYFTTKGMANSSGLGLAYVRGVCEQFGGSLSISSTMGHGTTIAMLFPAEQMSAAGSNGHGRKAPARDGAEQVDVMVVAHDPSKRRMIEEILSMHGRTAVFASSSREAIERLEQADLPGAVLVADKELDDIDGSELVSRINQMYPDLTTATAWDGVM